ncbi:hypothetical protein ABB37_07953 [Leptomonas pyrrhocoris]|uniref:Uncharacterized protein n=1 Tax=Leptomonas pyrrhocoris TaxID=157538 RepID=A0A0M9FUG8_LEPPY|nr:hypothetical protein ABB37_07953 [Leptomonas pyrrhocoris]KPA76199.1 hypothetical protein ABB37_07953 [Leptomonas pyrrhocoris]|eukprot:XP_015654638.1 hypothetical protein ABB37_07953 [Leptomonas pyrrhocoris]
MYPRWVGYRWVTENGGRRECKNWNGINYYISKEGNVCQYPFYEHRAVRLLHVRRIAYARLHYYYYFRDERLGICCYCCCLYPAREPCVFAYVLDLLLVRCTSKGFFFQPSRCVCVCVWSGEEKHCKKGKTKSKRLFSFSMFYFFRCTLYPASTSFFFMFFGLFRLSLLLLRSSSSPPSSIVFFFEALKWLRVISFLSLSLSLYLSLHFLFLLLETRAGSR